MFSRLCRVAVLGFTASLLAGTALAADINQAGAEKLKAFLQSDIDRQKASMANSEEKLITDGPLLVEPAGSYYAVTMPRISVKRADNKTIDLGITTINAIPGATDKEWKMAVSLANPIRILDAANKQIGDVNIGSQKASGVWNTDLNGFSQLNAVYQNVVYNNSFDNTNVTVPSVTANYNLAANAAGLWSGPVKIALINPTLTDSGDNAKVSAANIKLDMALRDHNPLAVKQFNEQMVAMAETTQKNGAAPITGQHAMGMYNLFTDFLAKSSDGFAMVASADGVSSSFVDAKTKQPTTMKLDSASFTFDTKGFMTNKVDAAFKLSYNGLAITPMTEDEAGTIPHMINLDISLNSLPYKELVDLGRGAMEQRMKPGAGADLAGMQAMLMLPQLLTAAGTHVAIRNTSIEARDVRAFVDGVVKADVEAKNAATAEIKGEVKGLDLVIQKLNTEAAKPNNPKAQQIKQTLGQLTMLQMMGQQKPDDPTTRTYHFVMDKAGKTMLNGADMSALGGMGAATPPANNATPR